MTDREDLAGDVQPGRRVLEWDEDIGDEQQRQNRAVDDRRRSVRIGNEPCDGDPQNAKHRRADDQRQSERRQR